MIETLPSGEPLMKDVAIRPKFEVGNLKNVLRIGDLGVDASTVRIKEEKLGKFETLTKNHKEKYSKVKKKERQGDVGTIDGEVEGSRNLRNSHVVVQTTSLPLDFYLLFLFLFVLLV